MKRLFLAFAVASIVFTGCKSNNVTVLEPVQEPSWFKNIPYFSEKNGLYEQLPIYEDNIVIIGDDYIDRGLWSEFYNDTTIKNRGITYDGIEHVLYRIDKIAAAHPAKIIVCAGFNDLYRNNTPVEKVIEMTGKVFERCHALSPKTHLYYLSIVGNSNNAELYEQCNSVNEGVQKLSMSGLFEYVDIKSFLEDGIASGSYSWNGGLHLNGAGYAAFAQAIERQIGRQHLNKAADVVDAKEVSVYYRHRVSLFRSLPRHEGKIVMLGNSLNNNAPWTELFPGKPIINRGISGDIVSGIDQRLDEIITLKPVKLFLQSGCNDMYNKEQVNVAAVWADYEKLIKDIKTNLPDTKLYVQSVFHIGYQAKYPEVFNAAADEVNKFLEAGAEKYGYVYLDVNSLLCDKYGYLRDELTFDGIHLAAGGYSIWTKMLNDGGFMEQ